MKIYPQNLVKSIQTIIDSGKVEISTFNSYDEFIPEINSCEIHIKFTKNSKGDREPIIMVNNSDITSQFINSWRTSAPGKFMCKDYRKDIKDFIGNTLYHVVKFTLDGVKMQMLVRLLTEITAEDCTESDRKELINEYGDLSISGKIFSIIKIMPDDGRNGWNCWDRYKSRDNNYIINLYETNSAYIDEANDDNDNNECDEDSNESEPLF